MSISAEDLIQPYGEIEPDFFEGDEDDDPTEVTFARLTAYVELGLTATATIEEEATQDNAVKAYVYWRALSAWVRQIRSVPTEQKEAEHSRKYSKEQVDAIEREALAYKVEFDDYLADEADEIAPKKSTTVAVRNEACW